MTKDQARSAVVVTDIQMPFWSMVIFMVKWAVAAIPAVLLLIAIWLAGAALLQGVFAGITQVRERTADSQIEEARELARTPSAAGVLAEIACANVPEREFCIGAAHRCHGNQSCIQRELIQYRDTASQRAEASRRLNEERNRNMEQVLRAQ